MNGFGNLVGPLARSVLYLLWSLSKARPKAIPGRTSYLRVRLAFHPYPQLIPSLFNGYVVRASTKAYLGFTLAMDRSPGFGSTACNYDALFRLGFPTAPGLLTLNLAAYDNSPVRSTKSTPSPTSGALTVCQHTVSGSISLPSRGAFHLSLTVLVHYRSPGVFSLGAWSPQLLTRFLVPRSTLDKPSLHLLFAYGAFTLCDCPFQSIQLRRSRL